MYSKTKIPEPFCRGGAAQPALSAKAAAPQEKLSSAEKPQATEAKQDAFPLLAFLLLEFFR